MRAIHISMKLVNIKGNKIRSLLCVYVYVYVYVCEWVCIYSMYVYDCYMA